MKKFVNILDEKKADYLESLGFKCRDEIVNVNGKERTVFVFLENEALYKILNDKKVFSRKDYYYSNIMRF